MSAVASADASEDAAADAAASVIYQFEKLYFELFRVHISIIPYLESSNEFLMMNIALKRVFIGFVL